jgi:hypothetical protein
VPSPGTGEISFDPEFTSPAGLDFSINPGSPCVDAGDPAVTDPDGTRSDMGAIYVDQEGKKLMAGS